MSERPKILLLGWSRLEKEEREGGGLNMFTAALARELARQGLDVSYLRTGHHDETFAERFVPKIVKEADWEGVKCWNAIGSPFRRHVYGASWWKTNSMTDGKFQAMLIDFLRENSFDILHFHSLEGFGFDFIGELKRKCDARVFVTLHDLYSVCEQGHFFKYEKSVCTSSEGGRDCAICRPRRTFIERSARAVIKAVVPAETQQRLVEWVRGKRMTKPALAALSEGSPEPQDLNASLRRELLSKGSNTPHQRMRESNVLSLNQADRVLVSTNFMRESLISGGVRPERISILEVGHPLIDRLQVAPSTSSDRLRFAFVGSTYLAKGLDTVLDAALLLEDLSHRIEIQVYTSFPLTKFLAQRKWPEFVRFIGDFKMAQLQEIAKNYEVGVVPHKCYESCGFTLLQHLALGKRVIVSNLGGGVEKVPRARGVLIEPDSPPDLARAIRDCLSASSQAPGEGLTTNSTFHEIVGQQINFYRNPRA